MDGRSGGDTSSFEDGEESCVVAECGRFEAQWQAGAAPRIEDHLENVDPPLRRRLLRKLLMIERDLRIARGELPTATEYLERRPDWASAVADVFARNTLESRRSEQPVEPTEGLSASVAIEPLSSTTTPQGVMTDSDVTFEYPAHTDSAPSGGVSLPERFGRYPVVTLLGRGGFGSVYLARDEELVRPVAIKVLHPGVLSGPSQADAFRAEARMAASLSHPRIVRVYDVGTLDDGEIFVVFEYVEGRNLADVLREDRPSPAVVASLLAQIAEAAHYAHGAGLIHRDLKPSNILVDCRGVPHIADFGLAIRADTPGVPDGEVAGTVTSMAPEQVRGETHRFDARTDVWALGVILYTALEGRPPFRGRSRRPIFRAILELEPDPPGGSPVAVPAELRRICQKCLAKRMDDRYETAAALADDLNSWLASEGRSWQAHGPATDGQPVDRSGKATSVTLSPAPIVPRGLRAFDPEDAEFFLRLVPGPRDRDGLPESIRAWRSRIEETDPARSFTVGLIYGPSGGGKSSFVKAGLLPRLERWIRPIYLEATAEGTEARLLAALRREFPQIPDDAGLAEAAAAIRAGRAARGGTRALVVLDQFEQWLHAHPGVEDGELVRALRQCDGAGLQAMLLVRDDFWMAITRFLRTLEVRPIEGFNSAAVEAFDVQHAGRVLAELGRALGRLDDPPGPAGTRFIRRAVRELAGPDGRVIPVRLTLLAEMLRHRDWTTATLRELGGFEGIGMRFLEETFSAPTAPPAHRIHQTAARAVLRELLPDPSSDLKGRMRPAQALRQVAGYEGRPADFAELMALLDNDLRMVTPVDPSGAPVTEVRDTTLRENDAEGGVSAPPSGEETYYQLTHDYLVPPVRQWLTRKQQETLRGRAEMRLATITALWRERPEPRRLPSAWDWLVIVGLTRRGSWSDVERRMMSVASRYLVRRLVVQAALIAAIAGGIAWIASGRRSGERAELWLARALDANYRELPGLLPELDAYRDAHRPKLVALESDRAASDHRRGVAAMLLFRDRPTPARGEALREQLTSAQAQPDDVDAIRGILATHPAEAGIGELNRVLGDESAALAARLRAGCALVALDPRFPGGPDAAAAVPVLAEALLAEHHRVFSGWLELLGPLARALVPNLVAIRRDPGRETYAQVAAAEALVYILNPGDRDLELARILVESHPPAARSLLHEFHDHTPSPAALEHLRALIRQTAADPTDEGRLNELATRQAAAATALAALGEPSALWPLLAHREDPRLRSMLIQRLAANVVPTHILLNRLAHEPPAAETQALLLAWAETRREIVPPSTLAEILRHAGELYLKHSDPGVHAVAALLIRRWDGDAALARLAERRPAQRIGPDGLGWSVGPNGHEFAIVPAPLVFRMGSPDYEAGRLGDQVLHYRKIDRSLAVSMTEVTLEQIRKLHPAHEQIAGFGEEPQSPATGVDWFEAILYCNRLSAEAGIDASRWCYPDRDTAGVDIPADAIEKNGYRLPTEAEWEYLARAGTVTARYFGGDLPPLSRYAWTSTDSGDRTHPVARLLPNQLGLFDVLGNVWEWCHDGPDGPYPEFSMPPYPTGTIEQPAFDPGRRQRVLVGQDGRETWRILRGGAFNYAPVKARSAHRDWIGSLDRRAFVGFRVVQTLPPSAASAAKPVTDAKEK